MRSRRVATELVFKFRRFVCEFYTIVFEKLIIGMPCFRLRENFWTHDGLGAQKPE